MNNYLLAAIPLLFPASIAISLLAGDKSSSSNGSDEGVDVPSVSSQIMAYLAMGIFGFVLTNRLVPNIKHYTQRKGICGKDLGKRGTALADKPVPEALGIVPGAVFLICLIFCLVGYATSHPTKLLDVNSALLSICFMLFLGFTDDVLDWPWRYKLVLPTVASLPLLCCYNGSTSIVVPTPFRALLAHNQETTALGNLVGWFVEIDVGSDGKFLDLGFFYLLYMGMLAVFCTNAINIYAGINGLEAGQSYVIGTAILLHNFIEIRSRSATQDNHLFSAMIILSFVGVTLGLLRHNWYPADVFVGDTFCYFAGMTFAVVGILGHFSKTLLLFFIPQVINFVWSVPQLFRIVPCPRHRLPSFNASTGLMEPSTFECKPDQYRWLKKLNMLEAGTEKIPNMTTINMVLSVLGPMSEKNLCTVLLGLQLVSCAFGFFMRYYVAEFFF
mmetsp:Transcript_13393/g.31303  ORF Transcript_13393/g.31303 Transcript_13393/m.31303 type:complete len:443 (+) Transcript_13393:150-1478(+)